MNPDHKTLIHIANERIETRIQQARWNQLVNDGKAERIGFRVPRKINLLPILTFVQLGRNLLANNKYDALETKEIHQA